MNRCIWVGYVVYYLFRERETFDSCFGSGALCILLSTFGFVWIMSAAYTVILLLSGSKLFRLDGYKDCWDVITHMWSNQISIVWLTVRTHIKESPSLFQITKKWIFHWFSISLAILQFLISQFAPCWRSYVELIFVPIADFWWAEELDTYRAYLKKKFSRYNVTTSRWTGDMLLYESWNVLSFWHFLWNNIIILSLSRTDGAIDTFSWCWWLTLFDFHYFAFGMICPLYRLCSSCVLFTSFDPQYEDSTIQRVRWNLCTVV